jgi:hypothetical protein
MAERVALRCQPGSGDSTLVGGGFTTTFEVTGPPILTRQLTGSNPLLSLQRFRMSGDGQRVVEIGKQGTIVRMMFDRAHVDGIFGSKAFEFDVTPTPPGNVHEDKLVEVAWGLAMSGRQYVLGANGEYRPLKADIDAHGEAFAVLIDAPVRFVEGAVGVGEEWTTEWEGAGRHKDTGARFFFQQTGVLRELTGGDAPQAHITFATRGTMQFPEKPSSQREESVLAARGTMILDLRTGLPALIETAGTVTTELKVAGVKLLRETSARYEMA